MIIDGHNDLVLHRWRGEPTLHLDLDAARAPGSPAASSRSTCRRRRRPIRRRSPTRCRCRADPARGGRADRGGAVRGSLRAAGRARDLCRRLPRGTGDGDRAHGGRRADRARPLEPRALVRARAALDRPRLVARRTPSRRAFRSVSVVARHRRGADGRRPRARARLQPARHPRRPLAPERGRLLGRRGASRRAARRDALERACALRRVTQPHRRAARRDPRLGRRRRRQLRRHVPARGRRSTTRRRRSPRSCGTSTTSSSAWGSTTSRSARTSTARSIPDELGGVAGLPKLVERAARRGLRRRRAREDHARELAARARCWHVER